MTLHSKVTDASKLNHSNVYTGSVKYCPLSADFIFIIFSLWWDEGHKSLFFWWNFNNIKVHCWKFFFHFSKVPHPIIFSCYSSGTSHPVFLLGKNLLVPSKPQKPSSADPEKDNLNPSKSTMHPVMNPLLPLVSISSHEKQLQHDYLCAELLTNGSKGLGYLISQLLNQNCISLIVT